MKKESRIKNSLVNSITGFLGKSFNCLLGLVSRTVFIHVLSTEYLGVNGLFENILYILNFAELGFGNAIIYNMYKPVANNNKEKVKSLMNLYKKVYFVIGLIILGMGILLIPFLDIIITDAPNIKESLVVIYLLYLMQTLSTYFYGYKKSILTAYQKDYITNIINFVFLVLKSIFQIVFLIVTKEYLLYLLICIVSNILSNIIISIKVDKMFPYLKDKKYKKVSKKEKTEIKNNVKNLVVYKVGDVVSNGTDNILISMFTGITSVGLFYNYNNLFHQADGIIWDMLNGLTGSIANVNVKESKAKKESILLQTLFVSSYAYGFLCICLGILINPFITLWLGKKYLLSMNIILVYLIIIYLDGFSFITHVYRNTEGLFKYGKFLPLISASINIILSIILGQRIGMIGIFLATIISKLLTTIWYMPYLIYKKCYDKKPFIFYLKYLYYTLSIILTYFISNYLISFIPIKGIFGFIVKAITTVIISNIFLLILFFKTKEFQEVLNKVKFLLKRRREV